MSTIDALEPNTLVRSIGKPAEQFTRDDIIGFIEREGITMINFRYVAGDGRLKKLNFPINSRAHLEQVLTLGERVDGSSLFDFVDADASQTVELGSADGSAQVHFMLAGLAVAARRGLLGADSLDVAERLYVAEDASKRDDLDQLPASCHASADALLADREAYEEGGVFPPGLIDAQAVMLRSWHDEDLSEKLFGNADALKDLVAEHLNCG